jgi:polyhydroxybutyrate depolymerase
MKTVIMAGALLLLMGDFSSCSRTIGVGDGVQAAETVPVGVSIRTLTVQGKQRYYRLYIPKSMNRTKPAPAILAFHGGSSTPEQFAKVTRLDELGGNQDGFVIAYPAGYEHFWHAGDDCCGPPYKENLDDVAFVRAVLDDLAAVVNIDNRRIFATGFSNGGNMTYRLACELSDRIAAVAINASSLSLKNCSPKRPVPILHFHGTSDTFHPYSGGKGVTQYDYYKLGAPETIDHWVKWDGCTNDTSVTYKKGAASCETHPHCSQGSEVTFCTIEGMGHQWPGFIIRFPPRLARALGPGNMDLSATDMLLTFFQKHPMPEKP